MWRRSGIQSHLVIRKAQNSGSFIRYSEVSEGIPYSEVCLYGSMDTFPYGTLQSHSNIRTQQL